ncbi:hypothetical protein BB559_002791 [Furculomyces boomerangus]|uniref:Transketolase-like pyrimidine-binding domain-containing protein n=1 Tax=Furculomyces boomerangus TaxID=61424 RepID=A0A2T9YSI3_9FUNG|nr:hypothetical protein BB559_002791 [Furculomyces boomerangus]
MLSRIPKRGKFLALSSSILPNTLKTPFTPRALSLLASPKIQLSHKTPQSSYKPLSRNYHEEKIYGYRTPKVQVLPLFNEQQLLNRQKNARLVRFVDAFRDFGHLASNLDPLGIHGRFESVDIEHERYGFTDMNEVFDLIGILHINKSKTDLSPKESATFGEILNHLKTSYSDNIGFEFMHIPDMNARKWFANSVENESFSPSITKEDQSRIFELLSKSEVLEHFMQKKYPQVKRYGLEGAESMMVSLDQLFKLTAESKIEHAIMCMPHRGRINTLTNLLNFPARKIFNKVQGKSEFPDELNISGDVPTHFFSDTTLNYNNGNSTKVSLIPNPSHLEACNPVALGKARAKQIDLYNKLSDPGCEIGDKVISVQLHGDASFTGQGVVMESLSLSNLSHYSAGGTVHIIVNNQIGYTTPVENARSTIYTSDIGKMINAPVIHVNGDYPEDVLRSVKFAFEYRNKFKKDVIIDLVTFRRWGHNELDEPSFTQPLMYQKIRARKSVPKIYEEFLVSKGIKTQQEIDADRAKWFEEYEQERLASINYVPEVTTFKGKWSPYKIPTGNEPEVLTGVDKQMLVEIGNQSVTASPKITVHPRLMKFHIQQRLNKLKAGTGIDWATAEALAFGSLLAEGHPVRISGEDVGRGTFSQRHAMLVCQKTEDAEIPLNNLPYPGASKLEVANSNLSELAVVGFEFGVSWESPNSLVVWEAQFGDFNTTAQVIFDTYLSGGESKWMHQSGLVLLLPHGYDGAGPEHSSCRIERFLQLCDDPFFINQDRPHVPNMSVVFPTTPAQIFHLLRRQIKRDYRHPLIIAGPKTLLRLSAATSTLDEMAVGTSFKPILDDPQSSANPDAVTRVVLLSGKIYYDLAAEKAKRPDGDKIALVRVEELCPFPKKQIAQILDQYKNATDYVWFQEETLNSGSFTHMYPRLNQLLEPKGQKIRYIGLPIYATPVTGVSSRQKAEMAENIASLFANL